MRKEILEVIVLVSSILWVAIRYFNKKKETYLFTAILLACILPIKWPLFFPIQIMFSLWSFAAAAMLLYTRYRKKKSGMPPFLFLYYFVYKFWMHILRSRIFS